MLTGNAKRMQFIHINFKFLLLILTCLVAGCSVIDVQGNAKFNSSKDWAILPFHNYSLAPRAGEKAEVILATLLRIKGITHIEMYKEQNEDKDIWPERDDRKRQENALLLAAKDNVSYAITGSIEEWQYKHGVGSEPAVGMTIWVVEVTSGRIIWSASGARSGWSTESLSGTAQKLLRELVSNLKVT